MFDTHSLFGYSTIATVVSQNANTVVVIVQAGEGSLFAINQQVTIWPENAQPLFSNAMVGRLTAKSGDQLTISIISGNREGSNTRTVQVNDQVANTITPKALTDIEGAVDTADKNHTQSFTAVSTVNVVHNLGKYPSIVIFDSAGDQVEAHIDHVSMNELNVYFSAPFTGVLTCN
jgi:hypothetical protein